MKKKHVLLILGVLIISFLFFQGCSGNSDEGNEATETGVIDPENNETDEIELDSNEEEIAEDEKYYFDDFPLTLLDGTETSLYAYEGKTIILNFWASWCTYCRQIMPLLDEFHTEQDDVVILAVNAGESRETIEKYIGEHGYDLEFFIDEESRISRQLGVSGLPTTVFIGPDFEYYTVLPGLMTEETLLQIWEIILEYQNKNL